LDRICFLENEYASEKERPLGVEPDGLYKRLAPAVDTLRNLFYAPTVEMKITFDLLRQGGYAL